MVRNWPVPLLTVVLFAAACAMPATTASTDQTAQPRPMTAPATKSVPSMAAAGETMPPVAQNSVKFVILGDTGTGERAQYDVGAQLWKSHQVFPYEFLIMVGDNMYGSERPQDYERKFVLPYKPIIAANIPFYASLGNHDDPNQRWYKYFNMNGERYYTFKKNSVRFFALDSNYMDREQTAWLEKELANSDSPWKIAFFHHPLYSSGGRHGSEVDLRQTLEPLFLKNNVSVVFAGHEHFYERLKPQKGIYYFTAGGSAKLRAGDITKTAMTEVGFDTDYSFVLAEVTDEAMHFQTLTRTGKLVDKGTLPRPAPTQSK
jgi:predicted phosphodiesterase